MLCIFKRFNGNKGLMTTRTFHSHDAVVSLKVTIGGSLGLIIDVIAGLTGEISVESLSIVFAFRQ